MNIRENFYKSSSFCLGSKTIIDWFRWLSSNSLEVISFNQSRNMWSLSPYISSSNFTKNWDHRVGVRLLRNRNIIIFMVIPLFSWLSHSLYIFMYLIFIVEASRPPPRSRKQGKTTTTKWQSDLTFCVRSFIRWLLMRFSRK